MSRPIALLLGKIKHAVKEWQALSNVADLKAITEGNRSQVMSDFKAGKYDGVVAIYRTFDSAKVTGLFDAELVEALPKSVKFVCHNGAGYDQIDVASCTKRGITVSNTPSVVDNATANMAMYLILGSLRRIWIAEKSIRDGFWRETSALGHDPEGKVLGILGMGGIGRTLAKRAAGFEMQIQYHNRKPVSAKENPTNATYVDLDTLLRTSDIISVHLPLNEHTHHFIGAKEIAKMKDGAVIVNTARGAIVDEQAMVDALESGKLFSVGLDVFENEPHSHPGLIKSQFTTLVPHLGTATFETQYNMENVVISNVRNAIEAGKLLNVVPEQIKWATT